VPFRYRFDRPPSETAHELAALLEDSVRIQCRSDAALGTHLSGGLDSSTVTALAARIRNEPPSFSIRFAEGGYYDETHYARAVARHAGSVHHEDTPHATDFFRHLPRLVWHCEMPLPNYGAYAYWTGSRLAARHVKVALTGHGGDEIFGGYPAQFRVGLGEFGAFAGGGQQERRRWLAEALAGIRRRGPRHAIRAALRRIRPGHAPSQSPADQWAALHCGPPPAEHPLLHPAMRTLVRGHDARAEYLRPFIEAPTDDLFGACLYHDLRVYLPGLLHLEDRASMAWSLESRVPLLDHRIVEYMATVPPEQKVPGLVPKGLLRNVVATWLPAEVVHRRDKAPFPVPMRDWLRSAPATLINGVLRAERCLDRGVLDPAALLAPLLDPDVIWSALGIELWYRIFVDGESVTELETTISDRFVDRDAPAGRTSARPFGRRAGAAASVQE